MHRSSLSESPESSARCYLAWVELRLDFTTVQFERSLLGRWRMGAVATSLNELGRTLVIEVVGPVSQPHCLGRCSPAGCLKMLASQQELGQTSITQRDCRS